jgi:transporter family-2 protein
MIYALLVPLVGALIPLMNSVNSVLALRVGNALSSVIIHIAGLIAVSAALVFRREGPKGGAAGGRAPFYLYLAGIVGVGTVYSCNLAYGALGASLSVALALFGQMLGSVAVDATGFLGRKKYPFGLKNLPGLLIAAAGVVVISWGEWKMEVPYLALAFVSGLLPLLSFILNSQLAERIGVMRGTRVNYLVGLAASLLILALQGALSGPSPRASVEAAAGLNILVLAGGGVLGVIMTGATNYLFPRIPALASTLLMFAGQTFAGLGIDAVTTGHIGLRQPAGALILLAGLAVNALLTRGR